MNYRDHLLAELAEEEARAKAHAAEHTRGRVVIFKEDAYRRTPTERLAEHLSGAGWTVEYLSPGLRPRLRDLKSIVHNPPTAIIRWEEQANVFKNQRWAEVCAWAYQNDVAPISVDYGYFDHFRTLMFDRYLPDASSAIMDEWAHITTAPIYWKGVDPRLRKYRRQVLADWKRAKAMKPLADPGYIAVFLQYSPALCRLPYGDEPDRTPIQKWTRRVYEAATAAGLRIVVKKSPLNAENEPDLPADVPVFETDQARARANRLLNLRILAHSRHMVMNCSSVANEAVLVDWPVVAVGRSWFNRAPGVFAEPNDWAGVCETPTVDHGARNAWTRFWIDHQGYKEELPARFDRILRQFQDSPDRIARSVQVRVPGCDDCDTDRKRVWKAVVINDTRPENKGRHLGTQANVNGLLDLCERKGVKVVATHRVGAWDEGKTPTPEQWGHLDAADLLIVNGEGSIHSGNKRAAGLLAAAKASQGRVEQAWLVSSLAWNCDQVVRGFQSFDYIAVRDIGSFGYLATRGIASYLAADFTFANEPSPEGKRSELVVCRGLKPPPVQMIQGVAKVGGFKRVRMCNGFYSFGKVHGAFRPKSVREALGAIADARIVVSSSFHGCAFAALQAVPFIPVVHPKHPPKQAVLAVESMGEHAGRVLENGPAYILGNYDRIVRTMKERRQWLAQRAQLNFPQ